MSSAPSHAPLIDEFRAAMRQCEQLYRAGGEQSARQHPQLVKHSPGEFIALMHDLHKGLLVKVFVAMVKADWRWSPEERVLTQELFLHVWNRQLEGGELKEALQNLMDHDDRLHWGSLLRPFAELPPLQERVGELETLVTRLANIIAKIDGTLHAHEASELLAIQEQLERNLKRVPIEGRPSEQPAAGTQAVQQRIDQDAQQVRHECELAEPASSAVSEKSQEVLLAEATGELDTLIGLVPIKQEVRSLINFLTIQKQREEMGLPVTAVGLHMVFAGNPGTGKTAVARIVGRIYGAMGILEKGHLIETDRAGLVAEYAGQTAPKANKKIDEALDGLLFIDEAYSLVSEQGDDAFGNEAVQTLLKRMEDDRERLVVVLAGYPENMQRLLRSNPGLSSRFNRHFDFPDYSAAELGQIFQLMCERNRYALPVPTRVKLLLAFQHLLESKDEHFGNGRLVRNVFEDAIRRLANRIAGVAPLTHEVLTTLTADDIAVHGVPPEVWANLDDPNRAFRVACPGCGRRTRIKQPHLAHRFKCKACGQRFRAGWGEPIA